MSGFGEKIIIYTDGASRGNPGPAGIGVVVCDGNGRPVKRYSRVLGKRTNNEAEYEAAVFALQKVKQLFGKEKAKKMEVEIRMDSQLAARQLSGKYKIREEKLFPLFIKIWNLRMNFGGVCFVEIPREKNKEADSLANEAMGKKKTRAMF